jgi:hypothetical protein
MVYALLLARAEVKEDRHIDLPGIFVVDGQLALIPLQDLHT